MIFGFSLSDKAPNILLFIPHWLFYMDELMGNILLICTKEICL